MNNKDRLFFIDFLKAIAIISVVSFHSIFVPFSTYQDSGLALEVIFAPLRFCVPIFLTISFFLFERGLMKRPQMNSWNFLKKRIGRLLAPCLFWFTVAACLKLVKNISFITIAAEVVTGEIFTGSYYLLVLFQLIPIFIILRNRSRKIIDLIKFLLSQLFVFGIIYIILFNFKTSLFIEWLRLINRPLFIYWFIYPVLGTFLASKLEQIEKLSIQSKSFKKIAILSFCCLLFCVDYFILYNVTDGQIIPFDYITISSIACVPILFLCCASISEQGFNPWLVKIIKILSRYSLGIFCINGILRLIFLSIGSSLFAENTFNFPAILLIKLLGWLVLLLTSLGCSMLLDRLGLKSVVT